jgi:hypothetical protein
MIGGTCSDQHRLGAAARFGAGDIARRLAATGRMADMNSVLEVQLVGQLHHVADIEVGVDNPAWVVGMPGGRPG